MTANAHPANHVASPSEGHDHGSLRSYLTGFALSVVLTAIPFWMVMGEVLGSKPATVIVIMAFAAAQIVIQIIYFLHMNTRTKKGWAMIALIFTILMVIIALTGSLWVMYHLNTNMMAVDDMRQMP